MSKKKNNKSQKIRILPETIKEGEIRQLIRRRRYQILIHSIIYYRFGDSIVEDHVWDSWAEELKKLQKEYPKISKSLKYYDDFKNWEGSSGFDLKSLSDPYLIGKAIYIVDLHKRLYRKKRIIRLHFK